MTKYKPYVAPKKQISIKANYIHNNGDKESVTVIDYDCKGSAWVRWSKDDFVNMVPVTRLELLKD